MKLPRPTWLSFAFCVLAYGASFDRGGWWLPLIALALAALSMRWPGRLGGKSEDE